MPPRRAPRPLLLLTTVAAAACGGTDATPARDAPSGADASPDAGCTPRALFTGGTAPEAQGWEVQLQPAATYEAADAETTRLRTQMQGTTSGQLLLHRAGVVEVGQPLDLEIAMQVVAVQPHNTLDAAVAILGAFTPPYGTGAERAQMVYVDATSVGWADDSQSAAVDNLDGAFHTYRLTVDAAGDARLLRDGTELLARAGFTSNGRVAIGDQSNDPGLDAELLLRSVHARCP